MDTFDIARSTAIVTGANTGLGKETAVGLAVLGARVVMTSRDPDKGERARREVSERSGSDRVECRTLDLASFASIRAFAHGVLADHAEIHVLVNNAGLTLSKRSETAEGHEATFGVNHLGPFLLTTLLLERMQASAPARIVNVASDAHRMSRRGMTWNDLGRTRRYRAFAVYSESKLANILFTRELARRLAGTGVTVNACHPGFVNSEFGGPDDTSRLMSAILRPTARLIALSPEKGARTQIWLASSPEVGDRSGAYYHRCREKEPSAAARDAAAALRLWELSETLVGG